MQVCNSFKLRLARVQSVVKNVVNRRLRKEKKRRSIQISEPFAFRHVTTNIKGLSEDELQVLREKAIASRFSTIDAQLAQLAQQQQQQQQDLHQKPARTNKTRAGYRGLTSSPLSASRPSITQSFAAEDSASQLSHTTASSTSGGSDHGCDLGKETLI